MNNKPFGNAAFNIFFCTSLLWIIVFTACAAKEPLRTWIIEKDDLISKSNGLAKHISLVEAAGYRCYSEEDDTKWRSRLEFYHSCCGVEMP